MQYQVVNPATGQVEREYPTATDAEIGAVLDRAGRAYPSWRRTPRAERADILRRVAQLYEDRAAELGAIITREMGKTTAEAAGELEFTAGIYRYYADNAADLLKDAPLQSNTPGSAWVRKSPIGALLGIMPWNYPYYQVARFAAPNLMIGNTIVLKHAPQCPESATAMEQIFHEAGLPADAYINVFASNEQAATMIADPRIAGVSVTGSERAGSAVAALAGQHLKKVVPSWAARTRTSCSAAPTAQHRQGGGRGPDGERRAGCNAAKRLIVTATCTRTSCPSSPPRCGRRARAALRRDQAVRRRPGAGPARHRRVREQEAHPHHAQRRVGKWPEPRPAGLVRAGDGSRTRMTSLEG